MAQNLKLIQGKQINVNLTGSFTGSFTGDGSGLANLPVQNINTGSLVTTSSFNAFTSSYNTGSFTGSFTGSLFGTASFAISSSRSVSSSFATTASFAQQADNANFATTAGTSNTANAVVGFQAATIDQINVGQTTNGDYAYIIRAQELEQSKHTTINIYNNLNFT